MASSKSGSNSKPGIEKREKQKLPASTVKKAVSRKPATTAKKASTAKKRSVTTGKRSKSDISPEDRSRMIAEAAYYLAERRGFQCKCCERDWLDAAADIDSKLKSLMS